MKPTFRPTLCHLLRLWVCLLVAAIVAGTARADGTWIIQPFTTDNVNCVRGDIQDIGLAWFRLNTNGTTSFMLDQDFDPTTPATEMAVFASPADSSTLRARAQPTAGAFNTGDADQRVGYYTPTSLIWPNDGLTNPGQVFIRQTTMAWDAAPTNSPNHAIYVFDGTTRTLVTTNGDCRNGRYDSGWTTFQYRDSISQPNWAIHAVNGTNAVDVSSNAFTGAFTNSHVNIRQGFDGDVRATWQAQKGNGKNDIYLYDLTSHQALQITHDATNGTNNVNNLYPAIARNAVSWTRKAPGGNNAIYVSDLNGITNRASTFTYLTDSSAGGRVISWAEYSTNTSSNIYVRAILPQLSLTNVYTLATYSYTDPSSVTNIFPLAPVCGAICVTWSVKTGAYSQVWCARYQNICTNGSNWLALNPGSNASVVLSMTNVITGPTNNVTVPSLIVGGAATFNLQSNVTVTAEEGVMISTNATLDGNGTVNGDVVGLGVTSPGNSPGQIKITGNYLELGTLNLEIASNAYDQVQATGAAIIKGFITVTLLGGFHPTNGALFAFLIGTNVDVSRATFNLPALSIGQHWSHGVANTINGLSALNFEVVPDVPGSPVYCSLSGTHQYPFANWANAATNLQAAVDACPAGSYVLVADGVYALTNQLTLSHPLTLQSANGTSNVIIDGGYPARSNRCIYLSDASAAVIGVTVINGYAASGGGIYCDCGSVSACRIHGNLANNGGGLYVRSGASAQNCEISGNQSAALGGGVYCDYGGALDNCTLVGNTASVQGGGVFSDHGGTFRNCIIYGNNAPADTNWSDNSGSMNCSYSCTTPLASGVGNTNSNPLFSTGYTLASGSPCIDTGTNLANVSTDLLGIPRPLDGNNSGTSRTDIGCYEYVNPNADSDHDGVADAAELIAGTNPTDSHDFFDIAGFSSGVSSTNWATSWSSHVGRVYSVQYCTNLLNPVWQDAPNLTNLPGTGGYLSATNTSLLPAMFFRLTVRQAP